MEGGVFRGRRGPEKMTGQRKAKRPIEKSSMDWFYGRIEKGRIYPVGGWSVSPPSLEQVMKTCNVRKMALVEEIRRLRGDVPSGEFHLDTSVDEQTARAVCLWFETKTKAQLKTDPGTVLPGMFPNHSRGHLVIVFGWWTRGTWRQRVSQTRSDLLGEDWVCRDRIRRTIAWRQGTGHGSSGRCNRDLTMRFIWNFSVESLTGGFPVSDSWCQSNCSERSTGELDLPRDWNTMVAGSR